MHFNLEINITHIITSLSVMTAAIGLLYKVITDQRNKLRKIGDDIKTSCCELLGLMERQRYIYSQFYDEIQPTLTEIDSLGLNKKEWFYIRDYCWNGMVKSKAKIMELAMGDKVEIAVVNSHIVQKGLNGIFSEAIRTMKQLEMHYYLEALHTCQDQIKSFNYDTMNSSELGNAVRKASDKCFIEFSKKSKEAIEVTDSIMQKIIEIDSIELAKKNIDLPIKSTISMQVLPKKKYNIPI